MSIFSRISGWLSGRKVHEPSDRTPPDARNADDEVPVAVIDVEQAYAAYRDGARFIDVREPSEWDQGHVAGAVHRPVADVEADPQLSVAKNTPVVTYCAAGARAARAAAALAAHGYENVHALQTGYADWQRAGYPIEVPEQDHGT